MMAMESKSLVSESSDIGKRLVKKDALPQGVTHVGEN
jgi:hypothetical protein